MADIYITLDQLEQVVTQLEAITDEFDNATSNSEALESAIGKPFGEGKLRDKARDFEERWDDKRGELNDSLKGIKEHVQGVVDGIKDWDAQTAIQLQGS